MPLRKKPLPRKRIFRKNVREEDKFELNPAKFKDHVEVIGKSVLGVVAFCYAVGILVESLYLGSFGVYHVSLFRFTYVFAGAWITISFLVPLLHAIGIVYFWRKCLDLTSPLEKIVSLIIGTFMFLLIISAEILIVTTTSLTLQRNTITGIVIVGVGVLLSLFAIFFLFLNESQPLDLLFRLLFGIGIFCFFMIFLGLFAMDIFPQIPARYGGGKPLTVQLLLEANKQNAWMIQKNFDLCENDKAKIAALEEVQLVATKPMPLLLATDTDYIIRKDENTAVSITRDQVKTVLYLDNVGPKTDVCADTNPPAPGPTP